MLKEFISFIDTTESIYDLIAYCYDSIYSIVDNEELFLAEYIDKASAAISDIVISSGITNPNCNILDNLSASIFDMLRNMMPNPYSNYANFLRELLRRMKNIELADYQNADYNNMTIPYIILQTIDSYLPSYNFTEKTGPKGNYLNYNTLVYLADNDTLIFDTSDKLKFREKVHACKITESFNNIRLVHKSKLKRGAGIPNIKTISIENEMLNIAIKDKQELSFAFIPYSNLREFDFVNSVGTSFTISYRNTDEEIMKKRCQTLLDAAICSNANIIVFPEYIVSKNMIIEIRCILKQKNIEKPKSLDSLMMVIAGSTWDESNNNILYIIDRFGEVVGEYYKYSKFAKFSKPNFSHGVFELCEKLTMPGKKCTLININGVGHVLPAICRDVIDEDYTSSLAEFFHPSMVIIPAWSKSIASFHERIKSFANRFYTSSFVCNSCQAKGEFSSCACIPIKPNTVIEGKIVSINVKECKKNCEKKGCIFLLKVNYNRECIESGNPIEWEQIRC
ncbi:MAG: hypothetical protein FWE14_04140 [Lachnospiraceae bacterium]|nr:hypothetical protein [Lachnospiraceae bacterium]